MTDAQARMWGGDTRLDLRYNSRAAQDDSPLSLQVQGAITADGMRANTEQRWVLPPGYTEQYAHHENFINAIRSRKPVIEDATFGLRAAGPALLSNVSHFTRQTMHWDPEKMVVKA